MPKANTSFADQAAALLTNADDEHTYSGDDDADDSADDGDERSNLQPEVNLQDKKVAAKLRGYVDEVLDWMEKDATHKATKKGILDRAEKEGFDRKAIVETAKEVSNPTSREYRKKRNAYAAAYGVQGDLFVVPTEH